MYLKKLKKLEQKIFTAPYRWLLKKGLIVAEKVSLLNVETTWIIPPTAPVPRPPLGIILSTLIWLIV